MFVLPETNNQFQPVCFIIHLKRDQCIDMPTHLKIEVDVYGRVSILP